MMYSHYVTCAFVQSTDQPTFVHMSTYHSATLACLPFPLSAGLGYLASSVDVVNAMTEHLCKQAVSEMDCSSV